MHTEVPPIIKKRQEAPVEPGERSDTQDDGEHQERAAAKGTHAQGRPVNRFGDILKCRGIADKDVKVESDRDQQNGVINQLVPVPKNRGVLNTHWFPSPVAAAFAGASIRIAGRSAGGVCRKARTVKKARGSAIPSTVQIRA
jgi:hypothetical protein